MIVANGSRNMFSADMLRCGSTHIQYGLCTLTGFRPATLVNLQGEGMGEQNINQFSAAVMTPYGNQFFGGHHVAYPETIFYLNTFDIKPIVCVRNLYDTIASLKSRLEETIAFPVIPALWCPMEDWSIWDDEQKYVWLAYYAGAWQLKFYVSWVDALIEKLWVRYEEFYANQPAGWRRILDYYHFDDMPYPTLESMEAQSFVRHNFAIGVSGRGKDIPKSAKKILDAQVDAWGKRLAGVIRERLYA